jgi:hypothetical protein
MELPTRLINFLNSVSWTAKKKFLGRGWGKNGNKCRGNK